MAFVHVVLIYGTNNVDIDGLTDPIKIHNRELGSKCVLAARICYAAFIWLAKFTVSEFLKRMTTRFWKRGYEIGLHAIRVFLVVTFVAVVIATLGECHPFSHYWQVLPDPGPQCRQGYAHLFTMGITDIVTDVLLVIFPIPIILRAGMPIKRKLSLIALFSMSVILIGITGARIPSVVKRRGLQQFRTVFASGEILAAAAVSNAIILGSFLRDRGVKKQKYKSGSTTDSMERRSSTRPATVQPWGSDEDLVRGLGIRPNPDHSEQKEKVARPAPVADLELLSSRGSLTPAWNFPPLTSPTSHQSQESQVPPEDPQPSPRAPRSRRVSFMDVGGLLEAGYSSTSLSSPTDSVIAHDFASQQRRGSILLNGRGQAPPPVSRRSSRFSQHSEEIEMTTRPSLALQDPGGLLSEAEEDNLAQQISSLPAPGLSESNSIRSEESALHRTPQNHNATELDKPREPSAHAV